MILLADGLRLGAAPRLGLVGSGGKTSALFLLARQLAARQNQPVWIGTTTHLGTYQTSGADRHWMLTNAAQVQELRSQSLPPVSLLTGPANPYQRLTALEGDVLASVYQLAQERGLPLLLEADGSRELPLKAPGPHEPALPPWVEEVLVCAGLSGLGQPFNAHTVHRPEIFARLSGAVPEQPLRPEHLTRLLLHPEGGLKRIPSHARPMVLLNQADTLEQREAAAEMAVALLRSYSAVAVASLGLPGAPVYAVYERVAGVVLAAGSATRFGQPKQLLTWKGETLVHRAARQAFQAGLWPVIVVTGAYRDEVEAAVQDLPVQCVSNPAWEAGQGGSVAVGIRALPELTGAAVFLLTDQPLVTVELLAALRLRHALGHPPLIAPWVEGRRANPVLFDRRLFPELERLQGEAGGRALFERYAMIPLPWEDPNLPLDVDTRQDWDALQANLDARGPV